MASTTRTAAATEAVKRYAADRAVDDPIKLDRAARIVRRALSRQLLTIEDLTCSGDADAAA
jgi:hypothetical protein